MSGDRFGYFATDLLPESQEDDDWAQQRVYGDFYRDPVDSVTRGLSLDPASVPSFSTSGQANPFDFYQDVDQDVFKGASLPPNVAFDESHFFKELVPDYGFSSSGAGKGVVAVDPPKCERFEESDSPPPPPNSSFWKPEVTTVRLTTRERPCQIGKALLDFLNHMSANILKVRSRKFTVKSEMFAGGAMAIVKIRIYRQDIDTYDVEFQRRSGDAVTFNRSYDMASKFLTRRFHPLGLAGQEQEDFSDGFNTPSPIGSPTSDSHEEDMLPLLDMAMMDGLQAEAAMGLAHKAREEPEVLCTEAVFKEVQQLLGETSTDVAYPTACLLSTLAGCPKAAGFFIATGMLPLMISQVLRQPAQLVQKTLAQAVNLATRKCAGQLDHPKAALVAQLTTVMQERGIHDEVYHNLQKALEAL
jgi:hypothetical protein